MDITTLLSDLASVIHGTTVNKVPNIYGHINRAARQVLQDVDPKETQKIVQLAQVFDDVFDYPCPVDLKGDREVDLRLQAGRMPWDVFTQDYAQNFDANKSISLTNKIYTQWNTGLKTLRIEAPTLTSPTIITDTSTIEGWTANAYADNLSLETNNVVAGGGALKFDLESGGSTVLGPELVTNGGFVGNANGWTLQSNWAYGTNDIVHTPGADDEASQIIISLEANTTYICSFDIVVTAGSIDFERDFAGDNTHDTVTTSGSKSFTVISGPTISSSADKLLIFNASSNFNGTITNVSVKKITASAGVGSIENSTLTPLDLSGQTRINNLFLWVNMPTGASFNSVELRWGSSASDYYFTVASFNQQGDPFVDGYNLLSFPWINAEEVGDVDNTTIQYVKVTFHYDDTLQTGVLVDNLTSNLGYIFQLQYYSKYIFRDPSTNVFQERVVDSSDNNKLINLDTDSYNLLFNKTAFYIAQALQGSDASYDAEYWDSEYQEALKRYKGLNPSEAMLKRSAYYTLPRKGYTWTNRYFRGPIN